MAAEGRQADLQEVGTGNSVAAAAHPLVEGKVSHLRHLGQAVEKAFQPACLGGWAYWEAPCRQAKGAYRCQVVEKEEERRDRRQL